MPLNKCRENGVFENKKKKKKVAHWCEYRESIEEKILMMWNFNMKMLCETVVWNGGLQRNYKDDNVVNKKDVKDTLGTSGMIRINDIILYNNDGTWGY